MCVEGSLMNRVWGISAEKRPHNEGGGVLKQMLTFSIWLSPLIFFKAHFDLNKIAPVNDQPHIYYSKRGSFILLQYKADIQVYSNLPSIMLTAPLL